MQLYGGDSSAQNYLKARVVTLPVLGKLYYDSNSDIVHLPMAVDEAASWYMPARNYTQGVKIYYQGPKDYFTSPTKTWNGTLLNNPPDYFSFKVQAGEGPGLADSLPVVQYVHIKNVNDPSVLSFSKDVVNMRRLNDAAENSALEAHSTHTIYLDTPDTTHGATTNNVTSLNSTNTDGPVHATPAATTPGSVILTGFAVVDPDLGVDPVHVTVASLGRSTFRLNSKYLQAVDFNSAAYCNSGSTSWVCSGDGTSRLSSFVAAPSDAVNALNGMTFTMDGSAEDSLVVTMFDGVVSVKTCDFVCLIICSIVAHMFLL